MKKLKEKDEIEKYLDEIYFLNHSLNEDELKEQFNRYFSLMIDSLSNDYKYNFESFLEIIIKELSEKLKELKKELKEMKEC